MSTGGVPLIGRTEELAALRARVEALRGGNGSLALIEGNAGAGKTRLLEAIGVSAQGAALEYAGAPYAPVRDVVRALLRRKPKVLQNDAALAQSLKPVLDLEPSGTQRRVLDAVVQVVRECAKGEPLTLAFEDIHWIDSASADVLAHLARHAATLPVAIFVTYRAGDASQRSESLGLLAAISRIAAETISLRGLSDADSMLLIAQAQTEPLPLSVRRTICELAQGNPLLLTELARHARADAEETTLPVSLQLLVRERLSVFDEDERAVLRVCAALEVFDHTLAAEISGLSPERVLEVLRKARAAGIVAERGRRFAFAHALIRHAVTSDVLAVELAQLHAQIALRLEAQEQTPETVRRLAYHYWIAGDEERSQRFNVRSAQQAEAVYAFEDASQYYERAINGRPIGAQTFSLYERLADTYERAARFKPAAALLEQMFAWSRAHRGGSETAKLGIPLSRSRFQALDDDGSIAAVREAIVIAGPDSDAALRFELNSILAWYLVHLRRTGEARSVLDEADRCKDAGSPHALVRYYEARAAYEVHALGGGEWREHVERAIEISARMDTNIHIARYANALALAVASEIDAYAYAFELLERMRPLFERGGDGLGQYMHMWARLMLVCGRLRESREALDAVLPFVVDGTSHVYRVASIGIPLALHTGDRALLAACSRQNLLKEAFNSKDPVVFAPVVTAVAQHMLSENRDGEAAALVEQTLPRMQTAGNNFDLLLLAARIGSKGTADRAFDLLAPWEERSRSAQATGTLMRAYRTSGKERAALAQRAAELYAALPWPLHQAHALEVAGMREDAAGLYAQCGASADALRLRAEARRGPHSSPLSPRELEVALLVGEGKSNRTIAETLVLSERTVENHIASIFGKLNMRSRSEIASYVARENARAV